MFAVLKTGGKQYRVEPGDVLRVEKLAADAGETIQFNDVLMVGDTIGAPFVAGAAVQATVIDQIKGEKLIHFVRRRRKHSSKRTKGHRQQLTLVRVTDILAAGADATGVKAAIGTGARPQAETGLHAMLGGAAAAASGAATSVAALAGAARDRVEDFAEDAVDRAGALVDAVSDTVSDVAEDVTTSTAAKVAMAAVAGVAALAAAALAGAARADETTDDGATGADPKE